MDKEVNAQAGEGTTSSEGQQEVQIDWSKVDWSKVEVPKSVIIESDVYKDVLTESIGRRHEIAELKKQLEPAKPDVNTPNENDSPQDILAKTIGKLAQTVEGLQARLDQQERVAVRSGLVQKYNLPTDIDGQDIAEFIGGDNLEAMEASAQKLASIFSAVTKGTAQVSSTSAANTGAATPNASLKQRVRDRTTGKENAVSPFDPGVMRQKGGGIVRNNRG